MIECSLRREIRLGEHAAVLLLRARHCGEARQELALRARGHDRAQLVQFCVRHRMPLIVYQEEPGMAPRLPRVFAAVLSHLARLGVGITSRRESDSEMRLSLDSNRLRPASFAVRLRPIMHTGDLTPSLAIAATAPVFDVASEGNARHLRLPICDRGGHACTDYEFVLHYARRDDRPRPVLQIRANGPPAPGPLYVGLVRGAQGFRRGGAGGGGRG